MMHNAFHTYATGAVNESKLNNSPYNPSIHNSKANCC